MPKFNRGAQRLAAARQASADAKVQAVVAEKHRQATLPKKVRLDLERAEMRDRDDAEDEYYREKRERERAADWDHNHDDRWGGQ